jgi:hypothetical protein
MKIKTQFILAMTTSFLTTFAHAQGTLFLSNLSQSSPTDMAVGSDSWIAQSFVTGANSGGYILDSVQLLTASASGAPGSIMVSIYTYSGNVPQNNLGTLNGLDPAAGGIFTYTTPGILLLPSTFYSVVVTTTTPVAQGAYNWSATDSSPLFMANNYGWEFGLHDFSTDGSTWGYSRALTFQFGIYATAIPEPSAVSLLLLGGGLCLFAYCAGRKLFSGA